MYNSPKLKPGCSYRVQDGGIGFQYRGQTFLLELDDQAKVVPVCEFLKLLDGTRSSLALQSGEVLGPDDAKMLLQLLDAEFCLSEGWAPPLKGSSGPIFLGELEDIYHFEWLPRRGASELATLVHGGEAPRDVIIGWCLESYNVTRRAKECLAPVIARTDGPLSHRLHQYFRDEYWHDKLLIKSLLALGFSRSEIAETIPLPYTAAMMNLLATWARSDLLSFMACLFMFEGPQGSGDEYIAALSKYDFPPGFVEGQAAHTEVDAGQKHSEISRELFGFVEYVSPEEKQRVIARLRTLFEISQALDQEIIAYYRRPRFGIPRRLPVSATSSDRLPASFAGVR